MEVPAVAADDQGALILDTMATGFVLLDPAWVITAVNERGATVLSRSREELLGQRLEDHLLPAGQLRAASRWLRRAVSTGHSVIVEAYHPVLATWFEVRAVPTPGGLGVHFLDITQRRQAQEEVQRTAAHLHLLDRVGAELSVLDAEAAVGRLASVVVPQLADWCLVSLVEPGGDLRDLGSAHRDAAHEPLVAEYAALRSGALLGESEAARVVRTGQPEVVGEHTAVSLAGALRPGRARDLVTALAPASSAVLPLRVAGRVLGVLGLYRGHDRPALSEDELVTASEVTARAALALDGARAYQRAQVAHTESAAAQRRAEDALERLSLLSEVGDALADPREPDLGPGVARLAQLCVPVLADWAVITLLSEDGVPRDVGWAHRDPSRVAEVRASATAAAAARRSGTAGSPVGAALRSGEAFVTAVLDDAALAAVLPDPRAVALARSLGASGLAVLPLLGRGQVLGALTLVTTPGRGPHTAAELETAHEVARRAGAALDRALLLGQQRRLSEALQRNLLTEPPQLEGAQIAVRYIPAAQEAQVGGDWYDAFRQPSGALLVAIGDVMGHDTAAATAMAQVRGLLRGIAYHGGQAPAQVLAGLDRAMDGLRVATTATCVLGRLEQTSVERDVGLSRLLWASAGHPPPVVVDPDGTVRVLDDDEPDLLLGLDATVERREHETVLRAGSTVLLYTDGLVERRGQSLDDGIATLCGHLRDLAALPLEGACDALLARMVDAGAEDDVALVAVRLRPAGPTVGSLADGPERPDQGTLT